MPDPDDDGLSEAEEQILEMVSPAGAKVMIDMNSDAEVERANRLLQRGLVKSVGFHMDDDSPGLWTLIARIEPGETPPPFEALVAHAHVHRDDLV